MKLNKKAVNLTLEMIVTTILILALIFIFILVVLRLKG